MQDLTVAALKRDRCLSAKPEGLGKKGWTELEKAPEGEKRRRTKRHVKDKGKS